MNPNVIFSILFVLTGLSLQNISTETLSWQVSYVNDVNTGARIESENERIVTYGSERIEWHNADGSIKYTYMINNVNGSWRNVSNNGSIVYQCRNGDQLGTITFECASGEIVVRVLLGKDEALPEIYEIKIEKITTL